MVDPFTTTTSISQIITGLLGINEQLKNADLKIAMAEHIEKLESFGMTNLVLIEKNSDLQAVTKQLTKELTEAKEKLEEKSKYRLKETMQGKFIYVLKVEAVNPEHPAEQPTECRHAVCPDCFKDDRIRILQIAPVKYKSYPGGYSTLECKCGSRFDLHGNEVDTIYD